MFHALALGISEKKIYEGFTTHFKSKTYETPERSQF
jgi:hypothetical protein